MSNLYECQGCLKMLNARSLFPTTFLDQRLQPHHFLLCRDCLSDRQESNDPEFSTEQDQVARVIENLRV